MKNLREINQLMKFDVNYNLEGVDYFQYFYLKYLYFNNKTGFEIIIRKFTVLMLSKIELTI